MGLLASTSHLKSSSTRHGSSIDDEYDSKLAEITEAIEVLTAQKEQINDVIEKKLRKLIDEKISTQKLSITAEEFIEKDPLFVKELRETEKAKYDNFINYNIRVLENAKDTLTYIRDI